MKVTVKIFELVEMFVTDQWEGSERTVTTMQEWFDNREISSEFEALALLHELNNADAEPNRVKRRCFTVVKTITF